jgi:hypothetical protein
MAPKGANIASSCGMATLTTRQPDRNQCPKETNLTSYFQYGVERQPITVLATANATYCPLCHTPVFCAWEPSSRKAFCACHQARHVFLARVTRQGVRLLT